MFFRRALQQSDQPQMTGDGACADRRDTPTVAHDHDHASGGWYQRLTGDSRRSALNTNDLRGKVLRIKVKDGDITAADANKVDLGSGTGAYTIPAGQPVPARRGRAAGQDPARGLRDGLP